MKKSLPKPITLAQWLTYIEAQHPKSIAMGLDRVREVANKLKLHPDFPIITIAGTNGKGSTCAMLAHIYHQAGYQVGAYTSPHLIEYNERVSINEQNISDGNLCLAFEAVELARGDITLTYFEIGTLAAVWHLMQADLDIMLLEVGMGGRLDAVNVFEPSCAIVTSIDLDHVEYLGGTRELIGREKAGIFRSGKLAICGELDSPNSIASYAKKVNADLHLINRDFSVEKASEAWMFVSKTDQLVLNNLALQGDFQLNNAACAITAVLGLSVELPVPASIIRSALSELELVGRFHQLSDSPLVIADVAHNPQAAQSLASNLKAQPCEGRTLAVFAMLADKDINSVIELLDPVVDIWYLAGLKNARSATTKALASSLKAINSNAVVLLFENVADALDTAYKEVGKSDRIVAFGSFYTVADALKALKFSRLPNE